MALSKNYVCVKERFRACCDVNKMAAKPRLAMVLMFAELMAVEVAQKGHNLPPDSASAAST